MHQAQPIDVQVERAESGEITFASIRFGPHFVARVHDDGEKVTFGLVYTHHGFRVDASEINGELETLINEIRASHPELGVD